jgi:hypothetical protein
MLSVGLKSCSAFSMRKHTSAQSLSESFRLPSRTANTQRPQQANTARVENDKSPGSQKQRKEVPLTRALRSHQLWLTITYFGLLALMGRGLAG